MARSSAKRKQLTEENKDAKKSMIKKERLEQERIFAE